MLASCSGQGSGASQPLFDVHREFILQSSVLHADETPVRLLDPGAGKTKRAYVWAYASSKFDPLPGVAYDFCLGRSCKYAVAFLGDWCGTLVRDEFSGYESVVKLHKRKAAGCLAHARRKFDELIRDNQSPVALATRLRIQRSVSTTSLAATSSTCCVVGWFQFSP